MIDEMKVTFALFVFLLMISMQVNSQGNLHAPIASAPSARLVIRKEGGLKDRVDNMQDLAQAHEQRKSQQQLNQASMWTASQSQVGQQLLRRLYSTYVKESAAVRPNIIHLDLLLMQIKNTIEKEGIFQSRIAILMEWNDPRLQWNPEEFDNLTVLMFDAQQLWTPDIAMTNAIDHIFSITRDSRFVIRVNYDGTLKYVPTGAAKTWCAMNLQRFPFDVQNCSIQLESWSYKSDIVSFDGQSQILLGANYTSSLWSLCSYHVKQFDHTYVYTNEVYTRLRFEFVIQRRSTFYVVSLIFPCFILSAIQLLVFFISSQETTADRIGFGTTNLLTLVVFQTIVTAEMPRTSDAVSALSKYIIALIILAAIGIVESVIVEKIIDLKMEKSEPPFLLVWLLQPVPAICQAKEAAFFANIDRYVERRPFGQNQPTPMPWRVIAYKLDFLTLSTCCLMAIASPILLFYFPLVASSLEVDGCDDYLIHI